MKKTLNINLGGMIFHIDDDAFKKLESYLGTLRGQFQHSNGGDEIINDVEHRMAELFRERTGPSKEVINVGDVDDVIAIMGKPEDYLQEEMANEHSYSYDSYSSTKKMHRDVDNSVIGGVCSGLGAYFNIDPIYVRILFLIFFFTGGFGVLLYLILWMVMPAARTTAEKLQMRGKPVTLSNIEDFVKKEGGAVGQRVSELGSKGGSALASLFRGIFNILRLIFKFILKLIGFFFLGIALIIVGSLVVSLFVGVRIDGVFLGPDELQSFLQLLALDSGLYNGIMIGATMLILGPLILMIYLGLRIIFGIEPLNSGARKGLALLTLAGLITLVISGIQIGQEFRDHGRITEEFTLSPKDGLMVLQVKQDSVFDYLDYDGTKWSIQNGQSYFRDVELDIRPSDSKRSYLRIETDAKGPSRGQARRNAQAPEYRLKRDTGIVVLANYYTLPDGAPWRAQYIRMDLFLAVGDTVFLSEGMERIIYDIKNIQNYWDPDMVGHYWTMTDRGLLCTDCTETERILEEWESEEWDETEAPETESNEEVIIRDGFLELEEKQVFYNPSGSSIMLALKQPLDLSYVI